MTVAGALAATSALLVVACGAARDGAPDEPPDAAATCGDGVVDPAAGEACEGDVANGACAGCALACITGWGDCGEATANDGCETRLTTATACGACATSCAAAPCWNSVLDGHVCASEVRRTPGAGALVADEAWSGGYWFTQSITLAAPAYVVGLGLTSAGTAGGLIRLALYADGDGVPGALVAQSEELVQPLGETVAPVPLARLPAGTYWVAAKGHDLVGNDMDATDATHPTFYIAAAPALPAPATWPVAQQLQFKEAGGAYSLALVLRERE